MNSKQLITRFNLTKEEFDIINKTYQELVSLYLHYNIRTRIPWKKHLKIKESEVFYNLIRLYRNNREYILEYLPLFIDFERNKNLDEILTNLNNTMDKSSMDYVYSNYGNLLINTMETEYSILDYFDNDKKEIIKRFIDVSNSIYRNCEAKQFTVTFITIDTFIDEFFNYVIFKNIKDYDKIYCLLDELEHEYLLFYEKIDLNNILMNIPGYLDNYFQCENKHTK